MTRIVDVRAFLLQYRFTDEDGAVLLHIEDDFLPENEGSYLIRTEGGKTAVSKANGLEERGVHCSVQQLASILIGFKRPIALEREQMILGEEAAVSNLIK